MYIDTYTQPNELTSRLFGLRFTNQTTEQRFREWRVEVSLPLIRLGMLLTLVSWLICTPLVFFWDSAHFQRMLPLVAGILVPTLLLGLAVSFHPLTKRWIILSAILLLLVNGLCVIYLFYQIGNSPGSAVIWCVYGVLFFPFMRLPPFPTLVTALPFMAWLVVSMIEASGRLQMTKIDSFTYTVSPLMSMAVAVVVCGVLDRMARQTFTMNQIISHQEHTLRRNGMLIRRYIPRSVAERIDAGDGSAVDAPQRRRITVLFSDIVGFTNLADRLDAESLTQILTDYMSIMAVIVEEHGGTLNEFSGDGLMSIFGAPSAMPPKDQATQAIKTARAMHAALPLLNASWSKLGIGEPLPLRIRIGINTGVLSVGSFGSEGRMTYTAIGLQTNVAARIQAQCKPGGVLLSDSTWHLVKDDIPCEPMGKLVIEGVQFLVPVYAPSHE